MHWLVTGISGSGKSRVMKQVVIPGWRANGVRVAVLDPLEAPGWGADFQTSDPFRFMDVVQRSSGIVAVIDEYAQVASDYKAAKRVEWCATVARNRSILSYFLAQRSMMIPPNVRNQCTNALLFQQTAADLAAVAELLNQPQCQEVVGYEKGLALMVRPFEKPQKIRVFHPK